MSSELMGINTIALSKAVLEWSLTMTVLYLAVAFITLDLYWIAEVFSEEGVWLTRLAVLIITVCVTGIAYDTYQVEKVYNDW